MKMKIIEDLYNDDDDWSGLSLFGIGHALRSGCWSVYSQLQCFLQLCNGQFNPGQNCKTEKEYWKYLKNFQIFGSLDTQSLNQDVNFIPVKSFLSTPIDSSQSITEKTKLNNMGIVGYY